MDGAADLLALLPEVQEALSEEFDGVECSISPGPVLSQSPFRLPFRHLGRNVIYVPDVTVSCMDDIDTTLIRLNLSKNSAVFTDGQPGSCLELALGRGRDWKTPLTKLFDRMFPGKWAFFVAELEQSNPTFHILCCGQPAVTSTREDTPDSTEQNSQVSSPTESAVQKDPGQLNRLVQYTMGLFWKPLPISESSTNFSLWIVPVSRIFAIPPPKKVKIVKKIVKKKSSPQPEGTQTNGEAEKKRTVRKVSGQTAGTKSLKKEIKEEVERDSCTPDANSASSTSVSTLVGGSNSSKLTVDEAGTSKEDNDSAAELRKKLEACEEKFQVNGEPRVLNGLRNSGSRVSITPDRRLDPIYEGSGKKERCVSPSKTVQQQVVCRVIGPKQSVTGTTSDIPFLALQLILSKSFSYQQLGQLRQVHPHWDEIAGQLLNSGYYQLLERCDKLLMKLQRRLPSEPGLHYVTSVLTNIQVHVLNPVDVMRAVLDEGVCCFPYGIILDKCFILLDQIEFAMQGGDEPLCNWEALALLSKKAALHYRTRLEKTMEERLGENLRLKAAQRILRLDSFIVESNVAKIEKDQLKVRDDLKWELEQVQQQNQQLRKDNRQLKQDHLKLEARVDILEQKFKTLARLLG